MQGNNQKIQLNNKEIIKQTVICAYSSSTIHWEEFDEVVGCVCKTFENIEIF